MFKVSKNKKGMVLVENVIFIVLNSLFLTILMVFLWKQGTGAVLMEQSYSKQIALLIDSAEPVTQIKINMEKGLELSEKNDLMFEEIVLIKENSVFVRLSEKGGYEYSFFNDVFVTAYPEKNELNENTGNYIISVNEK